MGRVLLIDGDVRPDGLPLVEPVTAWLPAWAGGTRPHPGQAFYSSADRESGLLRFAQRPRSQLGAVHFALRDVAEFEAPRFEIGRKGILLERTKTQVLTTANWAFSSWTAVSTTVTATQDDPAGTQTAFQLATSASTGSVTLNKTGLSNHNANTYVWSVWIRRTTGTGTCRMSYTPGGGSATTKTFALTTKWRRVWVTSTDFNSTTADLKLEPDINAAATVHVWGPQLELTGTGAGKSGRGRSTLMAGSSSARPSSTIKGLFAWPAAPWTLRVRFRTMWAGNDEQNHCVLSAYTTEGTELVQVFNSSSALGVGVFNRESAVALATTSSASMAHESVWDVVATLTRHGALSGYLNGVAFSTQEAAPEGLMAAPPTRLALGDDSDGNFGGLDGVVERLEVWDEVRPYREFA